MTENEDQPGARAPRLLSMAVVAAELRVSQQWLKYWLVANPVDAEGILFYVPIGRRWKLERKDIDRIIAHIRALEVTKLGPSVKSKIRLMGLMEQVGGTTYEDLLKMREAEKLRKEAEKRERRKRPRVRLPRAPRRPVEN